MKQGFAKSIQNVRRFMAAIMAAEQRGAAEAGWVLAVGDPGLGKTGTLQWFSNQPRVEAVYIRVLSSWSRRALVAEIVQALGGVPTGNMHRLVGQAIELLSSNPRKLVIDETEHTLGADLSKLEAVRDISDMTLCPVVIGGRAHIERRISAHPQFSSRIVDIARFVPLEERDVGALCQELGDVEFAPDAVKIVHAQARGSVRLARLAIANAERLAARQDVRRVTAATLGDAELCASFETRAQRLGLMAGARK